MHPSVLQRSGVELVSSVTTDTCWGKGHPWHCHCPPALGWAHQRGEELLYCSAVFWGSLLMAPVSSSLLAGCQLRAGAHTKHRSLCLKPFLPAERLQGWWDEPSRELCVCANLSECPCALCISYFHQTNKTITILLTPAYVRAAEGSERGCRSDARDPQACMFIPFPFKNGVFVFPVLWS